MSGADMKCVLAALALLLCVAATGNASAQGIQLRKQTKTVPLPAAAAQKPVAKPEAWSLDQLRDAAAAAYAGNRLYAPAGNNALEYYLALLDKKPDDAKAVDAVSDLLPMTVIAAEQYIVRGDFAEARRVVALIQQADASHPALSRLVGSIVAAEAAADAADAAAATARDRWLDIGASDVFTVYVDTQTLQRDGNDVTVWVKYAYDKPETDKTGDTYDEKLNLYTYHCATRQFTTKVLSQRFRGKPVWSAELKGYEQERKSVMPGTVAESSMEAVCGQP